MRTLRSTFFALTLLLSVVGLSGLAAIGARAAQETVAEPAATALAPTSDEAIAAVTGDDGLLRFDVAEDMSRFVFAEKPVHDDGLPAHGNPFITQGYIYPAGTLTESNGVLADGSPEFPELVLGEWTCRGWFVGEGAHATSGPMVVTTQIINFGGELGDATIVSEGYELADVGVAIERAITGGTGPYLAARGKAEQAFLGFNASEGVNLSLVIDLAAAGL